MRTITLKRALKIAVTETAYASTALILLVFFILFMSQENMFGIPVSISSRAILITKIIALTAINYSLLILINRFYDKWKIDDKVQKYLTFFKALIYAITLVPFILFFMYGYN